GRLTQDQASTGGGGERGEVDMPLVGLVVAADHTREHAGVGSFGLAADQRQTDAGLRAHGEAAQHPHMRVARPEEQNVRLDGAAWLHSAQVSAPARRFGMVVFGASTSGGGIWVSAGALP